MKPKKTYLLSTLLLVTLLVLVFTYRSVLGQYIFNPLAAVGQAAWQLISSIDQNIYWGLLIIASILMTIRIIPKRKGTQTSSAYNYNYKPPNPYDHWLNAFNDSALGPNEEEYLKENLQELYESFIASQSYTDSPAEQTNLPPEAKQFLYNRDGNNKTISYLLPRWLRRLAGSYFYKDNTSIDDFLNWMETQLEINNGD